MTGELTIHRCASVPLISTASDAKVGNCAALLCKLVDLSEVLNASLEA